MSEKLAGGVLANIYGCLLLIHRNTPELSQWELPGGKVEPGETSALAVVREIREELGVEVVVGPELGEQNFTQTGRDYSYKWLAATIIIGRPYPQEAIHDECAYFSLHQLSKKDDLSPNMRNLLKKLVDGEIRL